MYRLNRPNGSLVSKGAGLLTHAPQFTLFALALVLSRPRTEPAGSLNTPNLLLMGYQGTSSQHKVWQAPGPVPGWRRDDMAGSTKRM